MWLAVCDDDEAVINKFEEFLERTCIFQINYDCFSSGDEMLSYMAKNQQKYDMYFLDIEMNGTNGMEIARSIRKMDKGAILIFVSSYTEFMEEAFEVLAFRFLRKPITYKRFTEVLWNAKEYIDSIKCKFLFDFEKVQYSVNSGEIMYFEKKGKILYINLENQQYKCYLALNKVLEQLDTMKFVKIYSSIIVNLDYIKSVEKDMVRLDGEIVLPISRRCRTVFKEKLLIYTKAQVKNW